MPATPPPTPRHSWRTFSLRALLLFMAVVGTVLGLFMRQWNAAERQRKAVEHLRELGYEVRYDWQGPSARFEEARPPSKNPAPDSPARSGQILGIDFFHDVVSIEGSDLTDFFILQALDRDRQDRSDDQQPWDALSLLPDVTHIELFGKTISPDQARQICNRANLRGLRLCWCKWEADAENVHFPAPSNLEELGLVETHLPPSALSRLTRQGRLKRLFLASTSHNDAERMGECALGLQPSSSLRSLEIRYLPITPEHLKVIGRCTALEELSLRGLWSDPSTPVADLPLDSLAQLSALKSLRLVVPGVRGGGQLADFRSASRLVSLDLASTDVGDELLTRIDQFTSLQTLDLSGTSVTSAGLIAARWPKSLTSLSLGGSVVTVAVMESFHTQTQLLELHLGDIGFTYGLGVGRKSPADIAAAVAALQAALPNCQIDGDWPEEPPENR